MYTLISFIVETMSHFVYLTKMCFKLVEVTEEKILLCTTNTKKNYYYDEEGRRRIFYYLLIIFWVENFIIHSWIK